MKQTKTEKELVAAVQENLVERDTENMRVPQFFNMKEEKKSTSLQNADIRKLQELTRGMSRDELIVVLENIEDDSLLIAELGRRLAALRADNKSILDILMRGTCR